MKGINLELTTTQQFTLKAMEQRLADTNFSDNKAKLTDIIIGLMRQNMAYQNSLAAAYKEIIASEMGGITK